MTAIEAEQFGPARYRIVYADGDRGAARTLDNACTILRYGRALAKVGGTKQHAVRVEPVPGTQYRITYAPGGVKGRWWLLDKPLVAALRCHGIGDGWRATALELRSPVRP